MIKALIFDLDGTLLDSLPDIAAATNAVLADNQLPTHPLQDYNYFVGNGRRELIYKAVPEHIRSDAERFSQLLAEYDARYLNQWQKSTKPFPGIPAMLTMLQSLKLKLGILSNKPDTFTQTMVQELLSDWQFDAVSGAIESIPHKPDPTSANKMLQDLKTTASETFFIGDTSIDIQTALRCNITPIGVLWGFRTRSELESAGAAHIVNTPGEIVDLVISYNKRDQTET